MDNVTEGQAYALTVLSMQLPYTFGTVPLYRLSKHEKEALSIVGIPRR